jgi:hypothetical protein
MIFATHVSIAADLIVETLAVETVLTGDSRCTADLRLEQLSNPRATVSV